MCLQAQPGSTHLGGEQHGAQRVEHDEAQPLAVGLAEAKGPGAQQEEGDAGVENVLGGGGEGRLCTRGGGAGNNICTIYNIDNRKLHGTRQRAA